MLKLRKLFKFFKIFILNMITNVKKYGIIVIIAILFTFFCFSIVDLVMENPRYDDYCGNKYANRPYPVKVDVDNIECESLAVPENEQLECDSQNGFIQFSFDENGCQKEYECNTCNVKLEIDQKQYRLIGFIITSILGVFAIIVGLYSKSKDDVIQWIYSGFLIGGIITVFIGTMSYFHDMGRFVKPFVLLAEMILIIWIAIKTSKKK